jgi:hypothetical protein
VSAPSLSYRPSDIQTLTAALVFSRGSPRVGGMRPRRLRRFDGLNLILTDIQETLRTLRVQPEEHH